MATELQSPPDETQTKYDPKTVTTAPGYDALAPDVRREVLGVAMPGFDKQKKNVQDELLGMDTKAWTQHWSTQKSPQQQYTDVGEHGPMQYIADMAKKFLGDSGVGTLWGLLPYGAMPWETPSRPVSLSPAAYQKGLTPKPPKTEGQPPSPAPGDKVLGEYDMTGYATDPDHVMKISGTMKSMPNFTTPNDMTEWIQRRNPQSPLTGDMIMSSAKKTGIDPNVLLGLVTVESSNGTAGLGATTNNPGNVGNDDAGNTQTFDDFQAGLDAAAHQLARRKTVPRQAPEPIDWATATPEQKKTYSDSAAQYLKTATPEEKQAYLHRPRPATGLKPPPEEDFLPNFLAGLIGHGKEYGSTLQDKSEIIVDADKKIRTMHDNLKDWVEKTNEYLKANPPTEEQAAAIQQTFTMRAAGLQGLIENTKSIAGAAEDQRKAEGVSDDSWYQRWAKHAGPIFGPILADPDKPLIPLNEAWDYMEHDPAMVAALHLNQAPESVKGSIGSVVDVISGLTSLKSLGLLVGSAIAPEAAAAYLPKLAPFISMAIDGYFSIDMLSHAIENAPKAIQHLKEGKEEQGVREMGNALAETILGGMAGASAATRLRISGDIGKAWWGRYEPKGYNELIGGLDVPKGPTPPSGAGLAKPANFKDRIAQLERERGKSLTSDEIAVEMTAFNKERMDAAQQRMDEVEQRRAEAVGAPEPEPPAAAAEAPGRPSIPKTQDEAVARAQADKGRPLTPLERVAAEQQWQRQRLEILLGETPAEADQTTPSLSTTSRTTLTDSGGSVPETGAALREQAESFTAGRRPVMMMPPNTPPELLPPAPPGTVQVQTGVGTFWVKTPGDVRQINEAVADGTWPSLLGFISPQTQDANQLVVARNPQTGAEILSAQTRPEDVEAQKAKFQIFFPGAVVDSFPIGQGAQQVISERISGVPASGMQAGIEGPPEAESQYPPEAGARTVTPEIGQQPAIEGIAPGAVVDKDVPAGEPESVPPKDAEERNRGSIDEQAPLDDKGLAEADMIGARAQVRGGFDRLGTSDLLRARQTMQAISKAIGRPVDFTTGDLRPMSLGELEGQKTADTIQIIQDHVLNNPDKKFPGKSEWSTTPGESVNQFTKRVLGVVTDELEYLKEHPDQKIAVVTHYRIIKAIQAWLSAGAKPDLSVDPEEMMRKDGDPGSVYRLSIGPNGPEAHREDMQSEEPLKPGLYVIRHGTTGLNRGVPVVSQNPGLEFASSQPGIQSILFEPDRPTAIDAVDMADAVVDYQRKTIGGEERAVTGFDPRLIKVLGGNLYTGDLGKIAVKEMIQNSVAGIMELPEGRRPDSRIEIEVYVNDRIIKVLDTGAGMSPEIATKELVDMGGTHKAPGAPGGFGIAKAAIFTNAESIRITTAAVDPVTRHLMQTRLTGTADDWLDPEKGLKVETVDHGSYGALPAYAPTGTDISLTLSKDTRFSYYPVYEFLQAFMDDNMLQFPVTAVVNGTPVNPISVNKKKVKDLIVPGAEIGIYVGDDSTASEVQYANIRVLDTGIPQFDFDAILPRAIKMPKVWANIRATGKPEDANYPFRPDRQGIRDEASDAIRKYISDELFKDLAKGEVNVLKERLEAKLKLKGSQLHLFDTSGGTPDDLMKKLASADYMPKIMELVTLASQKMGQAINKYAGYEANMSRVYFGGLSVTREYYGLHIKQWMIPTMEKHLGMVLINPWSMIQHAQREFADGMFTAEEYPSHFARQLLGVLAHEFTHAQYGEHYENFSSALTRNIGIVAEVVVKYGELLGRVLGSDKNRILSAIAVEAEQISDQTEERTDPFGKISSSTRPSALPGYSEGAPETGTIGRGGLEEPVRESGEEPPGQLGAGAAPGPGRPGQILAETPGAVESTTWGLRISADDALQKINRLGPKSVRALGATPVQVKLKGKIVALGITKDLREKGVVSLIGREAKDAVELAKIAEVLRNPSFEVGHFVYVRNGIIVGHEAVTCRRPEGVKIIREDYYAHVAEINRRSDELGADQVWMLHNHPSGDPAASAGDVNITRQISKLIPKMAGGIVIDHEDFTYINRQGGEIAGKIPDKGGTADKLLTASIDHPALQVKIEDTSDYASVAKLLRSPTGMFALVYRDANGKVRAIEELPTEVFLRTDEFAEWIKSRTGIYGARHAIAVISSNSSGGIDDSDILDAAEIHYSMSVLRDVIISTDPDEEFRTYSRVKELAGPPLPFMLFGEPKEKLLGSQQRESMLLEKTPEEDKPSFWADPDWEQRLRESNAPRPAEEAPTIKDLEGAPPFPLSSSTPLKQIMDAGGDEAIELHRLLFEDDGDPIERSKLVAEPIGVDHAVLSEKDWLKQQMAAYDVLAETHQKKLAEALRYYHVGNRDPLIVEANQIVAQIKNEVPDKVDQQALFFYREFKNRIPELQQLLDGTHPYYDQFAEYFAEENPQANKRLVELEKQEAIRKIRELRPVLDRAMKPTDKMVMASGIMDDYFKKMLMQGQKEGFLPKGEKSRILPEDYITHIMFFDSEPTFGSQAAVGGPAMGQRFMYGSKRSFQDMAQGIVYEGATHFKPATLNALDAMSIYADRFAKVSAARKLQKFLGDAGLGEWSTANNPDRNRAWAPYTSGRETLWSKPVKFVKKVKKGEKVSRKTAKIVYYEKQFYGPKWATEALRPITDPNWMNLLPWYPAIKTYQGLLKTVQLSLSFFHIKAMGLCAMWDNPMILQKFLQHGWMQSHEFEELEKLFVAHGGTTAMLGKTLEAYNHLIRPFAQEHLPASVKLGRKMLKSAPMKWLPGSEYDPLADRLAEIPYAGQLVSAARALTEFMFGHMQRVFKVTSFGLQDSAWIANHPAEAQDPRQLRDARRQIAKAINAMYGGLQWEIMGVSKVMKGVAQGIFLAPDWFFSNVALLKYAFESAPKDEWVTSEPPLGLPPGGAGLPPPPEGRAPSGRGEPGEPGRVERFIESTPAGRKARWFILLGIIGGAVINELLTVMHTGELSKDWRNATIGKDRKGKNVKLLSPGFAGVHSDLVNFLNNLVEYGGDPISAMWATFVAKQAPVPRYISQEIENKDWLNHPIRIRGAKLGVNQMREFEHFIETLGPSPFTVSNQIKMIKYRNDYDYIVPEYIYNAFLATRSKHEIPAEGQKPPKKPLGWWDQVIKGKISQGAPSRPRR